MAPAESLTDRQQRRDQRAKRAVAAAVAVARAHGLTVTEPRVLNDLFSVMVHLRPAPVVARVPTWITRLRQSGTAHLEREIAVTSFLVDQGAPVVTPSRELPPGPHAHEGFTVSFWTYLEPDPDRTPTAVDCSAMLVDLHAVLRAYPGAGALPPLATTVVDLPRWLELLDAHLDDADGAVLGAGDLSRLHTVAEQLGRFLADPGGPVQPLHGDAHPGNLIATRDGLVWIDFEEVCLGPVEWDLATISDPEAVAAHHRPDPVRLARCGELRALQVALVLGALRDVFGDLEGWDDGLRSAVAALTHAQPPTHASQDQRHHTRADL